MCKLGTAMIIGSLAGLNELTYVNQLKGFLPHGRTIEMSAIITIANFY